MKTSSFKLNIFLSINKKIKFLFLTVKDCKSNLKWRFMQRLQCPIYNLENLTWSKMWKISAFWPDVIHVTRHIDVHAWFTTVSLTHVIVEPKWRKYSCLLFIKQKDNFSILHIYLIIQLEINPYIGAVAVNGNINFYWNYSLCGLLQQK